MRLSVTERAKVGRLMKMGLPALTAEHGPALQRGSTEAPHQSPPAPPTHSCWGELRGTQVWAQAFLVQVILSSCRP